MLNRQVYVSDNEFIICPIADEDRDNYVELHRQINGEHTLFLNEHCKDMMWEQVLEGEDKVFSVFEINGDYCGSLELQNPDSDTPEIGIDLFENKRNKGIAPKVVKLLAKRCYKDRKVDYFLIRRTEFISQARDFALKNKSPCSACEFQAKQGISILGIKLLFFSV